jgi:hypothetical protein
MQPTARQTYKRTLLVFNCHEAWVYQLGTLGYNLDIIVGLDGRPKKSWDMQMRPLPANSRLITLSQAVRSRTSYHCIVTHNTTDLLDIKSRPEPRIVVLHCALQHRLEEEKSGVSPEEMKKMLRQYLRSIGGHAVATSMFKGESWGLTEDIVPCGVDPGEYLSYSGETAYGLRICNFVEHREKTFLWDFHKEAFSGLPVRLVGHNPGMAGVAAADNWQHLKAMLRSHRFYIHTADPRLEAGYNMACLEAMAAGLPVLGNRHPTSPVKHGVSGFLSDDPAELRKRAVMLLENRNLAARMGQRARETVVENFSIDRFRKAFLQSIETARRNHKSIETKWRSTVGRPPGAGNSPCYRPLAGKSLVGQFLR